MVVGGFGRGPEGGPRQRPTSALVLWGGGEEGHTASLFPGSQALNERSMWVAATEAPPTAEPRRRITLTLPVINAAHRVLFHATGERKSAVVGRLLAGRGDSTWPAALVQCAGGVEWHVDRAAAGPITREQGGDEPIRR